MKPSVESGSPSKDVNTVQVPGSDSLEAMTPQLVSLILDLDYDGVVSSNLSGSKKGIGYIHRTFRAMH